MKLELESPREAARRVFIDDHRCHDPVELPQDASTRKYFRVRRDGKTFLVMDAPPPRENAAAFFKVTHHLKEIGVRAPQVYAHDLENGFLLMEDLGDQTFTRMIEGGHDANVLYRRALSVLCHIRKQARARDIQLPQFDAEIGLAEARLFIDWYLPARTLQPTPPDAAKSFCEAWQEMLESLPPLPPTLVLRDFHIDNLMITGSDCAVLDYQDAVLGSPAYDVASLFEDARRDVPTMVARRMNELYLAQNPDLPRRVFERHYIVWAAQRHCKVAGIFTRLWLRDGKDAYLRHLPRVLKLLGAQLNRPAVQLLQQWLRKHAGKKIAHEDFGHTREEILQSGCVEVEGENAEE